MSSAVSASAELDPGSCAIMRWTMSICSSVCVTDAAGSLAGGRRRHVDRPELSADAARRQPREVGHDRRLRLPHVELVEVALRLLPHRPRVVVVAVDDRRVAEQPPGAVEHAGRPEPARSTSTSGNVMAARTRTSRQLRHEGIIVTSTTCDHWRMTRANDTDHDDASGARWRDAFGRGRPGAGAGHAGALARPRRCDRRRALPRGRRSAARHPPPSGARISREADRRARRRQAARAEVRRGAHRRRHHRRRRRAEGWTARAGRRDSCRHGRAAGARADRRAVQVHRAERQARVRPRRPHGDGARRGRDLQPASRRPARAPSSFCSSRPRRAIRTAARPARGACSTTGRSRIRRRRRSSACTCSRRCASGQIGYNSGAAMASSDRFSVKIVGKQTHGAMPHTGIDPVPIAAEVVMAFQTIPEPPDRRAAADRRVASG